MWLLPHWRDAGLPSASNDHCPTPVEGGRTYWLEIVVKVVIVAIVAYASARTLGAAAASAMGGGLAGAVAAGAVVGATAVVASGAINGNLTWEGIFKGA
jgi:hypothetical protein